MSTSYLFALVLLLLAQTGEYKKSDFERTEGIYVLTAKNYAAAVEEFEYLLVYFYAPWCGHCKALGPEFVKAGQMLREAGNTFVRLAQVSTNIIKSIDVKQIFFKDQRK